jgi:hypothetical protein
LPGPLRPARGFSDGDLTGQDRQHDRRPSPQPGTPAVSPWTTRLLARSVPQRALPEDLTRDTHG